AGRSRIRVRAVGPAQEPGFPVPAPVEQIGRSTMAATVAPNIDRLAPTRRPDDAVVLRQRWARLGFLHWRIPVGQVRTLVPEALSVDAGAGQAWVGLVPFLVTGARPVFLPALPGLSSFDEVNVRTYVHYRGRDPGVWFFSLDASGRVAVAAARRAYKLD